MKTPLDSAQVSTAFQTLAQLIWILNLNLKALPPNGHSVMSKPGLQISATDVMSKVSCLVCVCDSLPPMVETQASCGCATPRVFPLP